MTRIGRNARFVIPCSLAAVLAALAGSTGCESMPGPMPPQVATVDYGAFPDDYETLIRGWVRNRIGDSFVVTDVQVTEPERGWYRAPIALGGTTTYGYKSFVSFSRHGQPGDLLSRHRYLLLFRDGRIALARPADELRILGDE